MSEIKFACCYCSQHIACDDAYCGNLIYCPACGRRIAVPRSLVVTQTGPNQTAAALPQAAVQSDPNVWTEEAWEEHVNRVTADPVTKRAKLDLPIIAAMAMLLPFLVFNGISVQFLWVVMVISALVSGILMRNSAARIGSSPLACAGAFARGLLCYAIFAETFLIGGCIWPKRF